MFNPFEQQEGKIKTTREICENVARHIENDFVLNSIKSENTRADKIKRLKELCRSYGYGGSEYSFNCNNEGINISKPFEKLIIWTDVFDIIKELPILKKMVWYQEEIENAQIIADYNKNKISHEIHTIQYNKYTTTNLKEKTEEIKEGVYCSQECSNYWGSGDSPTGAYGGGGFYSTLEEVKELFDNLIEYKIDEVKKPYLKEARSYGIMTSTKAEDIKLIIGKEAEEFLKRVGFDLNVFLDKYNSLKTAIATENDLKKSKQIIAFKQTRDVLQSKLWELHKITKPDFEIKEELIENKEALSKLKEEADKTENMIKNIDKILSIKYIAEDFEIQNESKKTN